LFAWTEEQFLLNMAGSPIRRIGYDNWLRNIAVALGNATTSKEVVASLEKRLSYPSDIVVEHVVWALKQHEGAFLS
jgi:epoxyqueuosine reductase